MIADLIMGFAHIQQTSRALISETHKIILSPLCNPLPAFWFTDSIWRCVLIWCGATNKGFLSGPCQWWKLQMVPLLDWELIFNFRKMLANLAELGVSERLHLFSCSLVQHLVFLLVKGWAQWKQQWFSSECFSFFRFTVKTILSKSLNSTGPSCSFLLKKKSSFPSFHGVLHLA